MPGIIVDSSEQDPGDLWNTFMALDLLSLVRKKHNLFPLSSRSSVGGFGEQALPIYL